MSPRLQVWDVLTDQEAVNLVRPLVMDPTAAAQALLREALDRDSTDNITCMIVRFAYEQQAKQ